MERDGLSSADQKLIRESWQKVGTSPLEHGTVLFTSILHLAPNVGQPSHGATGTAPPLPREQQPTYLPASGIDP